MGQLLNFVTQKKKVVPTTLSHEERCAKWRRHRAAETMLLREFDAVVAELDRVKENPQFPKQVRDVCQDYFDVIHRLKVFAGDGIVPRDVSKKLNYIA